MSSGTSEIEICLHFEQCRADFVSGHFKSETPTDLLIQLVALCVHSTAGSKSDLSNAASNVGLPFIKLWTLMPISEYVPKYAHGVSLTSPWQVSCIFRCGCCCCLFVLVLVHTVFSRLPLNPFFSPFHHFFIRIVCLPLWSSMKN